MYTLPTTRSIIPDTPLMFQLDLHWSRERVNFLTARSVVTLIAEPQSKKKVAAMLPMLASSNGASDAAGESSMRSTIATPNGCALKNGQ